jgi:Predicted ATPase (AAA+ superfamily)
MRDALRSLVALRGVLDDAVMRRLCVLLDALMACGDDTAAGPLRCCPARVIDAYAEFAGALLKHTEDWSQYLLCLALEDVNAYVLRRAKGQPPGEALKESVRSDLATLQALSTLDAARVKSRIGCEGFLPEWRTRDIGFEAEYEARMEALPVRGYGIYANYHMFSLSGETIVPVRRPDEVKLDGLIGYERQRSAIVRNTLALLSGRPAANALLYGDAGTGKSSTVKAVVNEYHERGLRLIEVKKSQVAHIPAVMEALSEVPLKFILFIDDLSFTGEGDDYYAIKAVLEGSASAKAANTVVYATSNRRHLVRELFSDRGGDDVNVNETLQELCALSDRFGLTVGFFKPNKDQYLEIVRALAARHGLRMDEKALDEQAERFALSSGRSPRAAQQLIAYISSMGE